MSSKSPEASSLAFPLVLIGMVMVAWALVFTSVGGVFFSSGTALSLEGGARETTGLQRASELLADDLKDAEQTSLVDGAGWAPSVTLSWADRFRGVSVPHEVQYTLQDDRLMRIEDRVAEAVAQDVISMAYSLADGELRAVFEVMAEAGATETVTFRIAMP